jgi:crotonobetainyl-CoA:carnitine CoA-transferase CaiB-like acyl-CoA transferase
VKGLGRPDLGTDARFVDLKARLANRKELTAALDAEFRRQTTAHWMDKLSGTLPIGPVYEVSQALENPFPKATGMISSVPHPERGSIRILASPIRINGRRLQQRAGSAAGADNEALLKK